MLRVLILLLLTCSLQAVAAPSQPSKCELSMYRVNSRGQVTHSPIISPKQVLSVSEGGKDPITGDKRWRVVLTSEGAAINSAYTKSHLTEKIAIFCGSREVMRPTIAGESSDHFVIDDRGNGP